MWRKNTSNGCNVRDRKLIADAILCFPAAKLYPPRTNAGLRDLFQYIVESKAQSHHKQSVIYYILRDLSVTPTNLTTASSTTSLSSSTTPAVTAQNLKSEDETCMRFARACYIPEKYRSFVEGLWWMDNLEFRVCSSLEVSWLHRI